MEGWYAKSKPSGVFTKGSRAIRVAI